MAVELQEKEVQKKNQLQYQHLASYQVARTAYTRLNQLTEGLTQIDTEINQLQQAYDNYEQKEKPQLLQQLQTLRQQHAGPPPPQFQQQPLCRNAPVKHAYDNPDVIAHNDLICPVCREVPERQTRV